MFFLRNCEQSRHVQKSRCAESFVSHEIIFFISKLCKCHLFSRICLYDLCHLIAIIYPPLFDFSFLPG